jgi:hypothetical protein
MAHRRRAFPILAALAVSGLCLTLGLWGEDPATRVGTIDQVTKGDSGIFLDVTLQGETAQPLNPQLSTGAPDPSQVMDPGATRSLQVAVGSPVKLVIVRQGAVFRFSIGTVDSVVDKAHCTVRVDSGSLNQTFQDPMDDNNVHSIGEFLKAGAYVAIWGVTSSY